REGGDERRALGAGRRLLAAEEVDDRAADDERAAGGDADHQVAIGGLAVRDLLRIVDGARLGELVGEPRRLGAEDEEPDADGADADAGRGETGDALAAAGRAAVGVGARRIVAAGCTVGLAPRLLGLARFLGPA